MINRIAIDGIDGSGKTTVAAELAQQLGAEGLKVVTFAPYQIVNERLGQDIYFRWFKEPWLAARKFGEVVRDCEAEAESQDADAVIYDRHWMTAFTVIDHRPEARAYWDEFGPDFVTTALLRVPLETALDRRASELTPGRPDYMRIDTMAQDALRYDRLSKKYGEHLLGIYRSDDNTPEAVAQNIAWDMRIRS